MALKLKNSDGFSKELKSSLPHTLSSRGAYIQYSLKLKELQINFLLFSKYILVEYTDLHNPDDTLIYLINLSRKEFAELDLNNKDLMDLILDGLTITREPMSSPKDDNLYTVPVSNWYMALTELHDFLDKRNLLDDLKYGG